MPHVDSHPPGSFCWFELGTTDQNAAKQFYKSLLGWDAEDNPMGPGEIYTTFKLDGRSAGACYQLGAQMKGVPPHWMLYVATNDADQTAAKATQEGGKVVAGPFDVMDFGRMAVLIDPTGAHISVWQSKTHTGTGIEGVPGTFCWADLMTPDQAAATKFYNSVFGWEADPGQDNSGYLHIKNGGQFVGGIPPAQHRSPGPPHWLLYLAIENCDASTDQAKSLGATVYMPPTTMEGVGRWSVIADPQGAVVALFQPQQH